MPCTNHDCSIHLCSGSEQCTSDNTREGGQGHQSNLYHWKNCPGIFDIHTKHLFLIHAWCLIYLPQTDESSLWGFGCVGLGKHGSPYMIMKLYGDYGTTGINFGGSTGLIHAGHFIAALTPSFSLGLCKHMRSYTRNLIKLGLGEEKFCFVFS